MSRHIVRLISLPIRSSCSSSCSPSLSFSFSSSSSSFSLRSVSTLSLSNLNPKVMKADYAVRGELVIKAESIKSALLSAVTSIPPSPLSSPPPFSSFCFSSVIHCNIGNPHELGQKPLTFFRQVLALCHYPALMNDVHARAAFPRDAIERAQSYLKSIAGGGTGAYTNSMGLKVVRDEIAAFIAKRDGHPSHPDQIFISDGASAAVKSVLSLLIRDESDGVLTPIPQYPLYSASLTLLGGSVVPYYLDESNGWGLTRAELERSLKAGNEKKLNTRALVVINPGNPTGQCLPENLMKEIVSFCEKHSIVLLADEVYQANIYGSTPFTSFKKVVCDMKSNCELISFHSVSKGFLGECGQRGGYMELHNIHADVAAQLYKLASVSLCSNTSGQLTVGLMCNPPKPGTDSYALYCSERDAILSSLKRRALQVAAALNRCEGIRCNPVEGALYAFPSITLPKKAVEEAKRQGKKPDVMYCLEVLESIGLCVVPGSGFGQKEGTWHFRTTILPSEASMEKVLQDFATFHANFMKKYS